MGLEPDARVDVENFVSSYTEYEYSTTCTVYAG